MVAKLNRCSFIGNLGRDPELKYTTNGQAKVEFSIGVDDSYKSGNEWKSNTQWVNVVAWGNTAEQAAEELKKGSLVYVDGKFTQRSWDNAEGVKQYRTEIVAHAVQQLVRPPKREGDGQQGQRPQRKGQADDGWDLPFE